MKYGKQVSDKKRFGRGQIEDREEIAKFVANRKLDIKLGQVDRKVYRKGNRNADKLTENKTPY